MAGLWCADHNCNAHGSWPMQDMLILSQKTSGRLRGACLVLPCAHVHLIRGLHVPAVLMHFS